MSVCKIYRGHEGRKELGVIIFPYSPSLAGSVYLHKIFILVFRTTTGLQGCFYFDRFTTDSIPPIEDDKLSGSSFFSISVASSVLTPFQGKLKYR